MKIKILIIILFFSSMLSFPQLPASRRSREAVLRQLSGLETEFMQEGLKTGEKVFIRIFKESKELEIWMKGDSEYNLFKIYPVCYYSGGLGTKTRNGDSQAPEGFYEIYPSSLNPNSNYHLSFNIGYPNAYDRSKKYTGSAVMVHGNCVSIGCYAMGDDNIEKIWTIIIKAFENGQTDIPIHIFPFQMTNERMKKEKESKFYQFWVNLQEGYSSFEENKTPPELKVQNGRYHLTK